MIVFINLYMLKIVCKFNLWHNALPREFSGFVFCFLSLAQSVERATPGEEVPGSIPAVAARSLLVGSVSV